MLFKNKKLKCLLMGAFSLALAVPFINIFLIYPHFSSFLIDNIEDTSIRQAQYIEHDLQEKNIWDKILRGEVTSQEDEKTLNGYVSHLGLRKLKIFSKEGIAVYSTDNSDIGKKNNHNYFHEKVAQGEIFSKVVKKKTKSLEGQTYQEDVVEVYVPSMINHNFSGAFELYYTITERISSLDNLIFFASVLPFLVSGLLLFALYWGFRNLDRTLIQQQKAEEEIRALQGIIPICMHCKEIRDDEGSWNQLETYIETHSEAQFSHGICDKCLEKEYGQEMLSKVKKARAQRV